MDFSIRSSCSSALEASAVAAAASAASSAARCAAEAAWPELQRLQVFTNTIGFEVLKITSF